MTELCRAVNHGDRTLIDPELISRPDATRWIKFMNRVDPNASHSALNEQGLVSELIQNKVKDAEARRVANEVFAGLVAHEFVVMHGAGG